jgi:hypothetical protein
MRFGIVDSISLKVINVCEWEGAEWLPPFGTFVVRADVVDIGDSYDPITHAIIRMDRTAKDEA